MTAKPKPQVKRCDLAREEWDFSNIPESELDACFYYEFARASKLIATGIANWRVRIPKLAEIKAAWIKVTASYPQGADVATALNLYAKAFADNEEANARSPRELAKVDPHVLDLVASFAEFPEAGWQSLGDIQLKAAQAARLRVPTRDDVWRQPGQCVAELTFKLTTWHRLGLSAHEMIRAADQHKANESIKLTHNLFGVSWNYNNDELAASFRAWVEANRPPQYPERKEQRKTTGIAWQKLPIGKRIALEYLGVWRRKQTCTWPEYLKKWPEDKVSRAYRIKKADQRREGQPEKSADESRIAQLKGEQAKALEVVQLIEGVSISTKR